VALVVSLVSTSAVADGASSSGGIAAGSSPDALGSVALVFSAQERRSRARIRRDKIIITLDFFRIVPENKNTFK
jgi:hypothetical protein